MKIYLIFKKQMFDVSLLLLNLSNRLTIRKEIMFETTHKRVPRR